MHRHHTGWLIHPNLRTTYVGHWRVAILSLFVILAAPDVGLCDIVYDGFSTTPGLTINGDAATANTSDGTVLRLTAAATNLAGSAFSTERVSTAQFTSVFSFRISEPGGFTWDDNTTVGADGLVFVVQNVANNAVGFPGGGIGYENIPTSIGVAFDTWHNSTANDPSQSYVGIYLNGSVFHGEASPPTVNITSPELGDGDRWWSWVIYNGTALDVYLLRSESTGEPARPTTPILTYNVNLASLLGQSPAFAGFTGATGNNWENHDVISWRYAEVPEPSSLFLLCVGILGLIGWVRLQSVCFDATRHLLRHSSSRGTASECVSP